MTVSEDEDENLAHFLESEVLSEASDQVASLVSDKIQFSYLFPQSEHTDIYLVVVDFAGKRRGCRAATSKEIARG